MIPSPAPPAQGDGAAGRVVFTAHDLAQFDMALDAGRLVTPASRELLWRAGRSPSGEMLPYGLGWYVQDLQGQRVVWHSGWWPQAYSALYLKLPERRATLILLANSEGLWWDNPLDKAEVEKSPFAAAFLEFLGTQVQGFAR